MAARPYRVASLGERLDAIGSRPTGYEVEPPYWNVRLTRAIGTGIAVFGLIVAGLVLL